MNNPTPHRRSSIAVLGVIAVLVMLTACSSDPVAVTSAPPTASVAVRSTNTPRPPSNTVAAPTNTRRAPTVVASVGTPVTSPSILVTALANGLNRYIMPLGSGAAQGFWQVYFSAPSGSRDANTYVGGIDLALVSALAQTTRTLDIAAYEFNNVAITAAVVDAAQRGVRVRVVTDNEGGTEAENTTLAELEAAGVNIVTDTRSALMHNKFMILDSLTVWTGSWNYTINDTYRNNNNALSLRSRRAVELYQAEFNEMFVNGAFGPSSPVSVNNSFTQDGILVEIYFAPEDEVLARIIQAIASSRRSIRFMAFSFTEDSIGDAIVARLAANRSITARGIFENTGSETRFSEMTKLSCANIAVRQDGNPFVLHHKVFIIDGSLVISGSFNFSANATNSNDENLIVIQDQALAEEYIREFDRRWAEAREPQDVVCS